MKNKLLFRLLLTVLIILPLLTTSLGGQSINAHASAPNTSVAPVVEHDGRPHLKVIETDSARVVLELTPPAPELEISVVDGQACQAITIPGLLQSETPGLPALPVQGAMLGIPQDATPTVEILAAEWTNLPGSYDLCPTAQPEWRRSTEGRWQLNGISYERAQAYQIDALIPAAAAELVSTGDLRSQRYAQLRLNPLQYNPVSGEIRYARRMVVEMRFNALQTNVLTEAGQNVRLDASYFEDVLRNQLLNYEQARVWRNRPTPDASAAQTIDAPQSQPVYKIAVDQEGLYQVSYSDLQTAGVPVDSLDPRTFQLLNQSIEAAIYVEGESDGIFNSTDYLLFYGEKVNTKYTDTNVYWLTWGGTTGLRMASLNGQPAGTASSPDEFLTSRHIEIDSEYFSDDPSGPDKDHWYWGMVDAYSAPAYLDFTTDLQHLSTASHTITVRGLLKGFSGIPNHHTRIYLNNNLIDDHSFPAGTEYAFSASASQSDLIEGTNTIRVECPRDGVITIDEVLVNWFEIDFYDSYFAEGDQATVEGDTAGTYEYRVDGFSTTSIEAYDVTNPLLPTQIISGTVTSTVNGQRLDFETSTSGEQRYLVQTTAERIDLDPLKISLDNPTSWKSATNGADYIIITHANFLSQAQSLAAYRSSQGLRVQVVDAQDLYDEFNGGVFSPEAIKSFLAYAYANWAAPAPSFVLLIGDGHYDFKNAIGTNEINYIPPYLDDVDPWTGETATDNRYVSVSGGDILPDMYIGRFPVRTTAEAQTMVDKTLNYEQIPPSGGWNSLLHFIADNADGGGNFPILSDRIINTYIPGAYMVDKVHYGVNYTNASAARTAIQAAINQGRLIVHYIGHASLQMWASEQLLKTTDIPLLTNGSKLPFFMPMTCAEGYFIIPNPSGSDYSALGEDIVRANGRGAIASYSATGYGMSSGHDLLDQSIFTDLFTNNQTQLGYLTTNAKVFLFANSTNYNDLIETYLLFGDPALNLQTLPVSLPAPTDLSASTASGRQIDLTWQDNSSDETEFQIQRSLDGSTGWTQVATVSANVTTYSDTSLACETRYYYRVRAYRAGDDQASMYSNTANAVTYTCKTLSFNAGWNLIALPLQPVTPYNAETLLLAINAQGASCNEVDQWVNGMWESYPLGVPFGQFPINLGQGYFVKCTLPGSWTMDGSRLLVGATLNLAAGWNLFGMPFPPESYTAQSLLDGINSQGGACTEVDRWLDGMWDSHPDGVPFNDFTIFSEQGYFIKCTAASTFDP